MLLQPGIRITKINCFVNLSEICGKMRKLTLILLGVNKSRYRHPEITNIAEPSKNNFYYKLVRALGERLG
jgi:hypothetical protein